MKSSAHEVNIVLRSKSSTLISGVSSLHPTKKKTVIAKDERNTLMINCFI